MFSWVLVLRHREAFILNPILCIPILNCYVRSGLWFRNLGCEFLAIDFTALQLACSFCRGLSMSFASAILSY